MDENDIQDAIDVPAKVSELLLGNRYRVLNNLEEKAAKMGVSRRHLSRELRCMAEASMRHQESVLQNVLEYVKVLTRADKTQEVLIVHHYKYDETPLVIKANYGLHGLRHIHRTKLFVIQEEYSVLLSSNKGQGDQHSCILLKGALSPQVRVTQTATAETIAEMLKRCLVLPKLCRGAAAAFPKIWTLVETDENSANCKAEKILGVDAPEPSKLAKAHIMCAAHKCHQVAKNVWANHGAVQSGCIKTLQVLKSPGMWHRFLTTMLDQLDTTDELRIVRGPLPEGAVKYREEILELFTPKAHESRRAHIGLRLVSEQLLSGDWRDGSALEHRCAGCCSSRAETVAKFKRWLPKVLKWLQVRRLELGDWQAWHRALYVIDFLSHVHRLFQRTFVAAFGRGSVVAELPSAAWRNLGEANQAIGERQEGTEQGDLTQNLRVALGYWRDPAAAWMVYLLQQSLAVEVQAMHSLLSSSGSTWSLKHAFSGLRLSPFTLHVFPLQLRAMGLRFLFFWLGLLKSDFRSSFSWGAYLVAVIF